MAVEIRVPALGESIVDAVVATWLKNEGDEVKQGEALVELETDKVNVEVSAEQNGVLHKILKREGDVVTVGDVLGMIGDSVEVLTGGVRPEIPAVQQQPQPVADGQRPVSPLARRMADE
ncbi:MAG TPA: biotin/lipoyl-containing protein, partial [Ktedonobacteraceae bacterium]